MDQSQHSGERTPLLEAASVVGQRAGVMSQRAGHRVKNTWTNFVNWVFQDNVIEVAIGLIIASTFSTVVKSFVSGILLPIISLLPFIGRNLEGKFAVLKGGPNENGGYANRDAALDDGATVLTYGAFIDSLVNFFSIGLCLYILGSVYGWMSHDNVIKSKVKCRFCKKYISENAKRCAFCTSWQQDGADEAQHS